MLFMSWQRATVAAGKVIIAYPTTSSQFGRLWFAKNGGIYQKYGLDPQLVYRRGFGVVADQVNLSQTAVTSALIAILRADCLRLQPRISLHVNSG